MFCHYLAGQLITDSEPNKPWCWLQYCRSDQATDTVLVHLQMVEIFYNGSALMSQLDDQSVNELAQDQDYVNYR